MYVYMEHSSYYMYNFITIYIHTHKYDMNKKSMFTFCCFTCNCF